MKQASSHQRVCLASVYPKSCDHRVNKPQRMDTGQTNLRAEGQGKCTKARSRTDDDEEEDEVVYHEGEDGEVVEAGESTQPSQTRKKGKERTLTRRVPKQW